VYRAQIQLSAEAAERLRAVAAARKVSMAAMIRRGVDLVIGNPAEIDAAERRRRAAAAAGRVRSGRRDLAREHDARLADAAAEP